MRCLVALWRRLFGPRPQELPVPELAPMSGDWCQTCHRDLRVGEVFELRNHFMNEPELGEEGGTWVASTYCENHAPIDALSPLPFEW